jgi:hypothetical protein
MALTICGENLSLGAALMSTVPPRGGLEPSHGCRDCDIPLWLAWSFDNMPYVSCPLCGEEAEAISYCPTCDTPACRNYALGYH